MFQDKRSRWRRATRVGSSKRIHPEHWVIAALVIASYVGAVLALIG